MTPTRRELLWTAARLGAGGTLVLTLGGCGSESSCNEVEIRLSSLLGERALPVGDAYLRMHPEERSGDALVAAKFSRPAVNRIMVFLEALDEH